MVRTVETMLLAVGVVLCLTHVSGLVVFTSSTGFKEGTRFVYKDLTLRCSLTEPVSSDITSTNNISIEIWNSNSGNHLEYSFENGKVKKISISFKDAQVTGQTKASGHERAYLQVSLKNPGINVTGTYGCSINTVPNLHKVDFTTLVVDTQVMFNAVLDSSVTVEQNHVVKFTKVLTNIGDAYNPVTGVFTCPVRGNYVFDVNVLGNWREDKDAEVCITINDECYNSALSEGGYQTAATSTRMPLKMGDTVKVVARWAKRYLHSTKSHYCSFSGHLVSVA